MQKTNSIHQFILRKKQILESHEHKDQVQFWQRPHKNYWSNFSFPKFVSAWHSTQFINSFSESHDRKLLKQFLDFLNLFQQVKNQVNPSIHSWATVNYNLLWPKRPCSFLTMFTHPWIIKITLSFTEFVLACKKSTQFINSFLRYSRF